MVSLIFGKDSFRSKEYLDNLIDAYHKKYPQSISFYVFDAEEDDLNRVRDVLRTPSFFDEKKLIIFKNIFLCNGFKTDNWIKDSINDNDLTLVFYEKLEEAGLKKKDKKLLNLLLKFAKPVKEFKPLIPVKFKAWIKSKFKENNFSVSDEIINSLDKELGNNLWRLKFEIDKLVSYAYANNQGQITKKDFDSLVYQSEDLNIFKTLDTLFSGNKAKALELLERHFLNGEDPVYLLSMLAYQLRNMLIVKDFQQRRVAFPDILKKTKMHPYVAKKIYSSVSKINKEDLIKKFDYLSVVDAEVKLGSNPEMSIFNLVLM